MNYEVWCPWRRSCYDRSSVVHNLRDHSLKAVANGNFVSIWEVVVEIIDDALVWCSFLETVTVTIFDVAYLTKQ